MMARLASALGLFAALAAVAAGTNGLSEAEIQGGRLAQEILEQQPAENFTNTGALEIRNSNGTTTNLPIKFEIIISETNWQSIYSATFLSYDNSTNFGWQGETITVVHTGQEPNLYKETFAFTFGSKLRGEVVMGGPVGSSTHILTGDKLMTPFAGSDFWVADLGLEFFHWPQQKILKPYEMRRSRSCKVLESTNPNPSPNGYSRVVSWIDNETLGIVQAEAYDAKGKLLKEFYPKDFKKVNGQWELGEMETINDQTGSRSWIKFDLNQRH